VIFAGACVTRITYLKSPGSGPDSYLRQVAKSSYLAASVHPKVQNCVRYEFSLTGLLAWCRRHE
jgi:hypothetical protein